MRMNYFPYIALGIVAVLGYWYVNNLTASIRELESKNAMLKAEVKSAKETLNSVRQSYIETNRTLNQYYTNTSMINATLTATQTRLARAENRIDKLAREHPKLVEKMINEEVARRLSCITAASHGLNTNDQNNNCN